jgi:hypothetical protein
LLLKYPSQNNNNNNNNNNEQDEAKDTLWKGSLFFSQNYNLITQQQQQQQHERIECFHIAHAFMLSIIYTQKVALIHTHREKEREAQRKVVFWRQ